MKWRSVASVAPVIGLGVHGNDEDAMRVGTPPVALTIAGTDSGGSAGLAADLKTFAAHRTHGVFAVTVVTAQNTTGIRDVHPITPDMVAAQLDTVLDDFTIAATKTGLLFTPEIVELVAERAHKFENLVIDPVLVTSAGAPMLDDSMPALYRDRLLPHAAACTPNVAEASLLSGIEITDRQTALAAAAALRDLGPGLVVVTGFLEDEVSVDVLADENGERMSEQSRVDTKNVLGTGCSLSAAIAAQLAAGASPAFAVDAARAFVHHGLRSSAGWRLGEGRGPIDHFQSPELQQDGNDPNG